MITETGTAAEAIFAFPELLRSSRKASKISQADLPKRIGVSLSAIRGWESLEFSNFPEEAKLDAIAEAYRIDRQRLEEAWRLSKKSRREERRWRGSLNKNSLFAQ